MNGCRLLAHILVSCQLRDVICRLWGQCVLPADNIFTGVSTLDEGGGVLCFVRNPEDGGQRAAAALR